MRLFGLIGKPLGHSFSRTYFTKKFEAENITDASYSNYELDSIDEIKSLVENTSNLGGLNVTIPFKEQVISFLHHQNEIVSTIKACNCIKILPGKKLHGFNTDVVGFQKSLEPKLRHHHNKAIILGSGGAAKAVEYVLNQLSIDYILVSRKTDVGISYEDLNADIIIDHKLVINTTPLGMYPKVDDAPPLPYHLLTPDHFLYDLIYNPVKTKFLAEGEKRGTQICNGEEMLVLQAEESWRIWNS